MKNNNKKTVTKREVAISFFLFMIIFLMFLTGIPKFYDLSYLTTPMIVGKLLTAFVGVFLVAYNGASFVYKILSYFEGLKDKESDLTPRRSSIRSNRSSAPNRAARIRALSTRPAAASSPFSPPVTTTTSTTRTRWRASLTLCRISRRTGSLSRA